MALQPDHFRFFNLHIGVSSASNYSKWGTCHMCMNNWLHMTVPPNFVNQLWCVLIFRYFFGLFGKWNKWTSLLVQIWFWQFPYPNVESTVGNTHPPLMLWKQTLVENCLPDRIASLAIPGSSHIPRSNSVWKQLPPSLTFCITSLVICKSWSEVWEKCFILYEHILHL